MPDEENGNLKMRTATNWLFRHPNAQAHLRSLMQRECPFLQNIHINHTKALEQKLILSVHLGSHSTPYGEDFPILTLEFDLEPPHVYRPYHYPVDESRCRHWIQIKSIRVFHIPDTFISRLLNILEHFPWVIGSI